MDAYIRGELVRVVRDRFEVSRRLVKENSRRKRFIDAEGEESQRLQSILLLLIIGG